jgi:diacylglycerol kinase family enzyme
LKIPKDPRAAAEAIMGGRVIRSDLGLVNGAYFVNVCGAGLLVNVSQQVDTQFKDALGKLAYYIKGLGQLPNFVPVPLRITVPSVPEPKSLTDEFSFFIVLNGGGAGGFDRLSVNAKIDDGKLDFIGFKAMSVIDVAALFLKVLAGDYLDDRRVVFLREEELFIESLAKRHIDTDTDGETGPEMPLCIRCQKEAIKLFVPEAYNK